MLEKTNQAQEESVKASTNDNSTKVIIIYTIKITLKLLLKILKSKNLKTRKLQLFVIGFTIYDNKNYQSPLLCLY